MLRETIENYAKTIFNLANRGGGIVGNKEIASAMGVMPATVTQTVNKLVELKLVIHEKSYGTRLTAKGQELAIKVVRRHRLWETYLARELDFGWDEVHEIAEALEHIENEKLIMRISEKLGNPSHDPHGDPIPDESGKIPPTDFFRLSDAAKGSVCEIAAVMEHSGIFLKHLDKVGLGIGVQIEIVSREDYDMSMQLRVGLRMMAASHEVCQKLLVKSL